MLLSIIILSEGMIEVVLVDLTTNRAVFFSLSQGEVPPFIIQWKEGRNSDKCITSF